MNALVRLNLGSGNARVDGYRSVDLYAENADDHIDLFAMPWPWEDNSVHSVCMFDFIEHVPDLDATVNEVYRILVAGGTWWVKVPHHRSFTSCMVGHRQFFSWWTFKMLGVQRSDLRAVFKTSSYRVRYTKAFRTPLDIIASRWPRACEQFMPPPVEIEWKGLKANEKDERRA